MEDYLQERNDWTVETLLCIDWDAQEAALKSIPRALQPFLFKYLHRWLPFGSHLVRVGYIDNNTCASCKVAPENHEHFHTCTPGSRISWQSTLKKDLLKQLQATNTDPDMKAMLMPALLAIFQNYTYSAPIPRGPFARAVQDQNQIGWSHFLAGRISHLWARLQTKYLKTVKKFDVTTGSTGEIWAKKLLSFLILRMHRLWKLRNDHRQSTNGEHNITTR